MALAISSYPPALGWRAAGFMNAATPSAPTMIASTMAAVGT
jgi:hypothetical protein